MTIRGVRVGLWVLAAVVSACSPRQAEEAKAAPAGADGGDVLLTVGSVVVKQTDLDYQIKDSHGGRTDDETRKKALEVLASRAQLVQAALDGNLKEDPVVRAEFARILSNRFKEKNLDPKLKDIAGLSVPESRLREVYSENQSRYRSDERRQAAVLWLDPKKDPERSKQYVAKLASAREWLYQDEPLRTHPEQGFGTLSVDHSEHHASRFKDGVIGWLERSGGMDDWSKAVAEILFSLPEPGAVSEVIARPEGVFLVRYMAHQAAVTRPFESVSDEIERSEKQRLRQAAESEFYSAIEEKYPVRWLQP